MTEPKQISIRRTRESSIIENILVNDYFDGPVCFFSHRLKRAAAKWLADSESVYFIVSETEKKLAGFVFAHTLGPCLWKTFAAERPLALPHLCYALLRRSVTRFRRKALPGFVHTRPHAAEDKVLELQLPETSQPFDWSRPDSRTMYVDLLSVGEEFRGRNLACMMLQYLIQEGRTQDQRRAEAHIDNSNYASIRAFLKAGWNVVKTSTNDFQAYIDFEA